MATSILNPEVSWKDNLASAIEQYLVEHGYTGEHTARTPERFTAYLEHMVEGHGTSPENILATVFPSAADQMIHRTGIRVLSTCEHHLAPFIGVAHFAYLPEGNIVGLSKISRLVRCFSQRLQVQEDLTQQIVDAFYSIVRPKGCGVHIRAYHFCEIVRGAREHAALTETTALKGCFKDSEQTREEFLRSIDRTERVFP